MFEIVLQNNKSEQNKIGKNIDNILTISGVLKDETSILSPSILVNADLDALTAANYMTIESFGRKYFITDIKSIRCGLVQINGRCDVLETYKDYIKQQEAVIARQENKWNLYLNDSIFKTYQNPIYIFKNFDKGFTNNMECYLLTVA
jgi:hypothetical protein